jgi:hypothetical protein
VKLAEKPEIAWRVIAARVLHGWEQGDLGDEFAERPVLRRHWASLLEGKQADSHWRKLAPEQRQAVTEILKVPMDWLIGPVDPIRGLGRQPVETPAERRLAVLESAVEGIQQQLADLAQIATRPRKPTGRGAKKPSTRKSEATSRPRPKARG